MQRGTNEPQTPNNRQNVSTFQKNQEVTLDLRKYILLLASLVATVTYAAGFSPPGDVWQDTAAGHIAGDPIIRDTHRKRYVTFFYCNATAFAASLVVIVIILILAYLEDKQQEPNSSKGDKAEDKQQEPNSNGDKAEDKQQKLINSKDDKAETNSKVACFLQGYKKRQWIALRTLQAAMVLDLLSLMGAYAAGTCRDKFTTIYSSVLVGVVVLYLIFQMTVSSYFFSDTGFRGVREGQDEERQPPAPSLASGNPSSGWRTVKALFALASSVSNKVEQDKAKQRFRKVLMLLATFAVSITYSAGLSMPGGFWDTAGAGHQPGDAILKDRHNTRLAVFFGFNTLAFLASLLIIVVLLDAKPHHRLRDGFIFVALFSLIVAYNAGSCRQIDTTVYVAGLIAAVAVYIWSLYMVADHIHTKWEAMEKHFRNRWLQEPSTPSTRNGRVNNNGRGKEDKTEKQKATDKARSLVLLLATLAATITYQAGLDPPGGVWQDNSGGHTAGDPILLTTNPRRYKAFFYCNSVSLVASLVAIVLAQKKFLFKHHVLEAVMILDLFGLIGAYAAGSCRDVNTSIHAMALAGAVLVYVVIHVVFITLDDDTHTSRTERDKEKQLGRKGKDDDAMELVEKTRKRLLLFAIFAATITYQAGLTPPGGFLIQDSSAGAGQHHAGDPVLLYNFPRRYKAFFYCNSVSFMLSIALVILLVNPNLYRPAIRTHALSVCTAAGLFGLMGAYAAGSTQHLKTSVYVFVLIAVVLVCIAILFLVFLLTGRGGGGTKALGRGGDDTGAAITQGGAAMEAAGTQQVVALTISNSSATTTAGQGAAISETQNNIDDGVDNSKSEHANRKYLMVLGILVASVTYQAGLEPPGGAWQSSSDEWYEAGNPVMHDNRRPRYLAFFYSNSTSFMASLVVTILLLLVPPEKLIGVDNLERRKKWLVVMNTTIVLDLLGLLGAYAAGSSRRWKTSVYVLLLVIGVLVYMGFHLLLSCIMRKRSQSALRGDSSA